MSDDAWAPVINEQALISPPAAAAGAVDADEGGADGDVLALVAAAAEVAALAEVDAEVAAVGESAWVWVAGGLLAGAAPPDAFELLLQAVALRASTAMVAVAARVLSRMAAPKTLAERRASRCLKQSRST